MEIPRTLLTMPVAGKVLLISAVMGVIPARADSVSLVGSLDPNNANDVVLVEFALAGTSNLDIQSYGFGGSAMAPGGKNAAGQVIPAGGFDTYFSLFSGSGPGSTFLTSNDDGMCPPGDNTIACRDSTLSLTNQAAGTYTLALSVFDNFSFAENQGSGTLGDGFIGLGDYFNFDCFCTTTSNYAVDISANGLTVEGTSHFNPVPEPETRVLVATGLILIALIAARIRERRFR